MRVRRDLVWIPVFAALVAFAVPWPLWGVDRVVAGLPAWIWWHVGWLVLCSAAFRLFVRSGAWERGMGLDSPGGAGGTDASAGRGDRR
ncbi:DUF3311 domain-containing protein [Halorubrum aethiopicum]|uniref:DUF3311 domain-containing protein n=1 Tax=Halorubrum aethiopicum TaxID=1758255 RepID=UPI000833DB88|nr:DUF3311 domain-containing protein [Halorubrum aethiopicum]